MTCGIEISSYGENRILGNKDLYSIPYDLESLSGLVSEKHTWLEGPGIPVISRDCLLCCQGLRP